MKLISCKINGFGALKNQSINFNNNLECICEKNGFGKSTLFAFIQAMLYGMGTTGAKDKELYMRAHFLPFDGTAFGGELAIQVREKTYYIKRTFNNRTSTQDTLSVKDGNGIDVTSELPNDLGKHFFGIDEDAFQRTVAFSGEAFNNGAGDNETISKKLNTAATGIDPQSKDKAIDELDKLIKEIGNDRRRRDPGKIAIINEKIDNLEKKIATLEATSQGLPEKHLSLENLEKQFLETKQKLDAINNAKTVLAYWEHYEGLTHLLKTKIDAKSELSAKYPKGFPSDEQTQSLKVCNETIVAAKAVTQQRHESIVTSQNIPSDEKLNEIKAKAKQYSDNQIRLQTIATQQAPAPKMPIGIIIAGIVLLIVGVVLAFTVSSAGYVAVVIGAGMTAFALSKAMSKTQTPNNDGIRIKQDNDILENELRDFFSQFGMHSTQFSAHCLQLEKAIISHLEHEKLLLENEKKIACCEKQIASIFAALSLEPCQDIPQAIFKFSNDRNQMAQITKEIANMQQRCEDYKQEKNLTEKPVIDDSDLERLKAKHKELQSNITRIEDEIKQDEDAVSDIDSLQEQKENLLCEKSNLQAELAVIEKTKDFIEQANKNLLEKYVAPIKGKYVDFIKDLLPSLANITMDHTYKISFQLQENGTPRDCAHLSSGERICLEMALRMALIHNMFKEEPPFIMMDDPFAELDEENLSRAKDMVRALSAQTQIIYLCCHPNRAI